MRRLGRDSIERRMEVDRPGAGHPRSPAVGHSPEIVAAWKNSSIQRHLDTVHLPFVEPKVTGDLITGSGASDMKGGIAAAVRSPSSLTRHKYFAGRSVMLTAHDLHEAPWGFGQQLDQLIRDMRGRRHFVARTAA